MDTDRPIYKRPHESSSEKRYEKKLRPLCNIQWIDDSAMMASMAGLGGRTLHDSGFAHRSCHC